MSELIEIDGGLGSGGGQILRSALSLSILQQRPIRMLRIRAGRAKPGLMRQHLTCVKAAKAICGARIVGAVLGSQSLEFEPQSVRAGDYHFSIDSAGSAILVLQTVLPALLCADRPSQVRIDGGTHNMLAPSATFFAECFLPMLQRMGGDVQFRCERVGLFPSGGGQIFARIVPSKLKPIRVLARGELQSISAQAMVAGVPMVVAERELAVLRKQLKVSPHALSAIDLGQTTGPGNVLSLTACFEHVNTVVTAFGEKSLPSAQVANRAVSALHGYLKSSAPVGEYLSDQLLLPMWLAGGGEFSCAQVSAHLQSNAELVNRFGGPQVSIAKDGAVAVVAVN